MGKKHFSDIGDEGPHERGGNIEDLGMTGGRRRYLSGLLTVVVVEGLIDRGDLLVVVLFEDVQ